MSDRLREQIVPNPRRKDSPYFSGDLIRSNGVHALNTRQHHSMRLQTLDRDNFHPSISQHHLRCAEGQHGRTEPAQDEIQLGRRGGSLGNDFQLHTPFVSQPVEILSSGVGQGCEDEGHQEHFINGYRRSTRIAVPARYQVILFLHERCQVASIARASGALPSALATRMIMSLKLSPGPRKSRRLAVPVFAESLSADRSSALRSYAIRTYRCRVTSSHGAWR
jgi:hypothetical protein